MRSASAPSALVGAPARAPAAGSAMAPFAARRTVRVSFVYEPLHAPPVSSRMLCVDVDAVADSWFDQACALFDASPATTAMVTPEGRALNLSDTLMSLGMAAGSPCLILSEVP